MNHSEKPLEQEFQEYTELLIFAKALNALDPNMDDISLALKSVSTIGDLLKKAANAADAVKNADLIDTIASLKLESATLKTTLANAEEKILALEKELKLLKENNTKKEDVIEKNGIIFYNDKAHCPNCWHSEKSYLIELVNCPSTANMVGYHTSCPKCNKFFAYRRPA